MLKAIWLDPFHVEIRNSENEKIAEIPVNRGLRTKKDLEWVLKHDGNIKTSGVVGIVNMLSQGCFRAYTGYPQSGMACYSEDGRKNSGCYANQTRHAQVRWGRGFDVIHNGALSGTEEFFKIKIPEDLEIPSEIPTKIYRVDSETADGSMSLALGLVQDFAAANPGRKVTTISSAYFEVPPEQLARAAELENLVVGFTFSPWFDSEDLSNRLAVLSEFLEAGVTSVIWVATNPAWEKNEDHESRMELVNRALAMVRPEAVIEVPYHDGRGHEHSSLDVNPWGACCDHRVDSKGRKVEGGMVLGDAGPEPLKGKAYGRCTGCKLQCGVRYLNAEKNGKFEEMAA